MKPVSRSKGRSAVAAAAYRAGDEITNMRDGLTHDFTHKHGIENAEIVLPEGVQADWARDRSTLWNTAELTETRKDARVAREFEVALPHELDPEQRLELTRSFSHYLADRYGAAVDFAVHAPHGQTFIPNYHAHILMTTRMLKAGGLGEKTHIEQKNQWLLSRNLPTSHMQLRDVRQAWEEHANEHLARAGHAVRIDHRSHQERGLEIKPTQHVGVHATQMDRNGKKVNRARLDEGASRSNLDVIREKPEQILELITGEKSVFDRYDVARALNRYIDDLGDFQLAFAQVMASPALVELQGEQMDAAKGTTLARYSTREIVDLESSMAAQASAMHKARDYEVNSQHVEEALARHNAAIRAGVEADTATQVERGELDPAERQSRIEAARLSNEQRKAIEHITGAERIAAVVGYAGAGKSTMMAAAREAWEAQGYRVHGAAFSGKAAEGLEESSGIQSRTLASWQRSFESGGGQLGKGDVLVIDEAGMVGSRQLAQFVSEAEAAGAKLVLVGDHEQLQAIGAGAPFRAIAELTGSVNLQEIRRQRSDWQRQASVDFASERTVEGLAAYAARDAVRFEKDRETTRAAIVGDYIGDRDARPDGSRVVLAHRRADVQALNDDIRAELQARGKLAKGEEAGEVKYRTRDGNRTFAAGDRIVFLENNRDLGVKNGLLGTVEAVEAGKITAALDGKGEKIEVPVNEYQAFDHGYATTIHKSQGSTVDRAYVMASSTMDRHLAYVAMTRHRDEVKFYAAKDEFENLDALSSRLSRAGSKETTLDYLGADERPDAEQPRGSAEDPARDRPQEGGQEPEGTPEAPAQDRRPPSALEQALDGFVRVYREIERQQRDNLPVPDSQRVALRQAGRELEKVCEGTFRLVHSTLQYDADARQAVTTLSGRECTKKLILAMDRELRLQADPEVRLKRSGAVREAEHEHEMDFEQ